MGLSTRSLRMRAWAVTTATICAAPGGCGEPEAERFCSRCLLSSDTQHMIERCNRLTAYQLLNELIPRLEIAAEDQLFGTKTELESTPLAEALGRRIAQAPSRTIVLWLHGDPQDWEFDEWPASRLAETWGPRGVPIRFVVRADAIWSADITTRQSLARLVQRSHSAELVECVGGVAAGTPLAALLDNNLSLVWASRDGSAGGIGAEWGRSSSAPIVRGGVEGAVFGVSLWRVDMPRTSWRGFLRLSLTSCPIYLSTRRRSVRLHPAVYKLTSNIRHLTINFAAHSIEFRVDNPQHRGDLMARCRLMVLHMPN
jgi:hypothetical protein